MPPEPPSLPERDLALLWDMLLVARDAQSFLAGLDEAAFLASRLHQAAVIRALEVLGEAAGRVSRESCGALPQLPWRGMTGPPPLAWQIEHCAVVEVVATNTALLDALLVEIGAAITADRTLGGTVEWAQPGAPSFDDVETEGAAAYRAAAIPVTLVFTVAGSPIS